MIVFLGHVTQVAHPGRWAEAGGALEEQLRALCEQGRAAWPDIDVSNEDFIAAVACRVSREDGSEVALSALHAADLFLACGCARGLVPAVAAFERDIVSRVPAYLGKLRPTDAQVDEIKQALREQLLVARSNGPPRIAEYAGRGPLGAWVRVAAVREALRQQGTREAPAMGHGQETMLAALTDGADLELEHIRERCKGEFAAAFKEAVAQLTSEQRNLLRMYFVDELSGAQMATVFQVNRSTVVRWLQSAREALAEATKRILRERLRLSESEMNSLVGLVYSKVDVSIAGFLRERG